MSASRDPNLGRYLASIERFPKLDRAAARVRERLEARAAERGGKSQFWTKLERWIAAVVAKLPPPARLPPGARAKLTALDRRIAALAEIPADALERPSGPTQAQLEVAGLGPARAAVEAGELDAALDQLVGFWAGCRSPRIAAIIERLGLLVDEGRAAPDGENRKARQAAWLSAAEQPRPSAVGPLLASLREAKLVDVETRIEAMLAWAPDPRVARAMMVLSKDYMLGARDRLWRAVYDVLVHHADPRDADQVRERHARLAGAHVRHRHASEGREIRRVFEGYCAAVEVDHALDSVASDHAEAIEEALAERVASDAAAARHDATIERRMVEAIVAAWADDGPRLVYSDWLQSREDARGQFIALDVALAAGKKVKGARETYLRAHQDALFGPLAGIVGWRHEFERGLLARVQISTRKGGLDVPADRRREILEDLRWATVRALEVSYDEDVAEILARAPLLGLESIRRPSLRALQGFAGREDTVPLRSIDVSGSPDDGDDDWARFGELAGVLPQVESIAIMIWGRAGGRMTPPPAFFRGELVRRAKTLVNGSHNTGGVARIDEWIARMLASACPTPQIRVIGPEFSAEVAQVELGRFEIDMRLTGLRFNDRGETGEVLDLLRGLPRAVIGRVSIEAVNVAGGELAADLDAALEGLPVC